MKTLIPTMFTATLLAGLLASLPAAAQTLADPTRPPPVLDASRPEGAAAVEVPRLQSVLISPRANGRRVAVIDGETVRLGDNFRGARVARMTQTEVELVRGRERQVLRLDMPSGPVAGMSRTAP